MANSFKWPRYSRQYQSKRSGMGHVLLTLNRPHLSKKNVPQSHCLQYICKKMWTNSLLKFPQKSEIWFTRPHILVGTQ